MSIGPMLKALEYEAQVLDNMTMTVREVAIGYTSLEFRKRVNTTARAVETAARMIRELAVAAEEAE